MSKARCFISREKQVFLVAFCLLFPKFPQISKKRLVYKITETILYSDSSLDDKNYDCSFDAKLSWKKFILEKKYVFYKIYIICRKNVFMWKKSFILKIFFTKKTFFTEKNINKNVKKYISRLRNIFLCRKCMCYK